MPSHARPVRRPAARGPLSAHVLAVLEGAHGPAPQIPRSPDPDDLHLALHLCYELHYGGLPGVPDDLEWDPHLIAFRRVLERWFEADLFDRVGPPVPSQDVRAALPELIRHDDGPSLSSWMVEHGTLTAMREFVVHRSSYQLKEADPHSFAIPRLPRAAKAGLVSIQAGEYGVEHPDHVMHSELFARTMRDLGLDDRPNAYLDQLPATTLANGNLVSMFGLNRRWRGALVGHLSVFEMTSVEPMGRYSAALERMGASPVARRFYDVHVMADAVHEVVAVEEMAGPLADEEPELAGDILFGARAVIASEGAFAQHLLDAFAEGRSSLLEPVAA
ncbi:iron-containing redox enzyme family protein [Actinomarinicola tropica]|uniref:Iron-containing redox enzyme family protein n=1 Tax=Actinomarinicola tropica TaxID=2789776 RepID=A0A5Q2R9V4_9ACTN|nr:iron-containing redox enzyme family protein [Actinomarinicola tropica]QGG93669.1 iron-containing redox enzyme family protein [Actinomarinicola tropica]